MNVLQNVDLFFVGVSIAAIGILGFAVFFNNKKSITNQTFLFFSIVTIVYGIFNYMSYRLTSSYFVLWFLRLTLFSAVWHAFTFFQLFFVFPEGNKKLSRLYLWGAVPLMVVTSFLTLTPLVFSHIEVLASVGQVTNPVRGPGMPVFGIVTISFVILGLYYLIQKTRHATEKEKKQYQFISVGSGITFSLLIIFNVILPVSFNYVRFVPFAPVFILPFIVFTAYAIIRHGLLTVKVISTEILTFVLAIAILLEVLLSSSKGILLYRVGVFFVVISIGLMLIKSVRKEVEQREQVTKLAESLETANIRLQELDRQKTEFLSIASHQLRTPLSIIKGYLELIRDGAYGKISKKMIPTLDNMDESNERLIHLIDEFLNISRIEQGRTKFTYDIHQLNDTVTSVVNELTERAAEKGMDISWKPKTELPTFTMDEEKIRHVVFNFVDNAIKYSIQGSVKVTIDEDDGGVTLRVKDDGLGFNKDDEANFYQKFYRGKNVEGTNVNGTGLGLFVCRKFIEAHGGRVWAKSPGLGKGSEFGFWIPMSKEAPKTIEVTESPSAKPAAKV